MMIPLLTPLDSGVLQVILCAAGSAVFAVGLGVASNKILRSTSLV